jgi:tetratricopeptide (TPR) repeat protein
MNLKLKFPLFFLFVAFTVNIFAQQAESGFELYEKGEYKKAAEVLQKVVEADEQDQKPRLYLGMSYAKLKKEEEAVKILREADKIPFRKLAENEIPPKFLSKPRANYTDLARQNGIQGTVKLAIEFGADGKVKFIFPFQKLPNGLTENVIETAKKILFEPAKRNDKPISFVTILKYSFTIY